MLSKGCPEVNEIDTSRDEISAKGVAIVTFREPGLETVAASESASSIALRHYAADCNL